jgi:hypothetical protein
MLRSSQRRGRYLPLILRPRGNRFRAECWRGWLMLPFILVGENTRGNSIHIGRGFRTKGLLVTLSGQNNTLHIGRDVRWSGYISLRGQQVDVRIGDRTDGKSCRIVAADASIFVGAGCLVAQGVEFRSSDIHQMYDRRAPETPLNPPAPVRVGDGIWIAGGARIGKGVSVAPGCVIGAGAVVLQPQEEPSCLLVGAPARIARREIVWQR